MIHEYCEIRVHLVNGVVLSTALSPASIASAGVGTVGATIFPLYIVLAISFIKHDDLSMFDEYIECVSVEVEKRVLKTSKNVVISMIYRPPNTDVRIFIDKMNILLDTIMKEHKLCNLLGDYNLNILNYDTHDTTAEFIDILYSHAILPLINRPTRVTQSSATAIDNI